LRIKLIPVRIEKGRVHVVKLGVRRGHARIHKCIRNIPIHIGSMYLCRLSFLKYLLRVRGAVHLCHEIRSGVFDLLKSIPAAVSFTRNPVFQFNHFHLIVQPYFTFETKVMPMAKRLLHITRASVQIITLNNNTYVPPINLAADHFI
jgi:hypothetical protein